MTNEEERDIRTKLDSYSATFRNGGVVPSDMARDVFDLAERLLKENSELRVRDSNVTMHSLNVMSVNEDLVNRKCGTCRHWRCDDGRCGPITSGEAKLAHIYVDFSAYETELCTNEDFGCVLWEKK